MKVRYLAGEKMGNRQEKLWIKYSLDIVNIYFQYSQGSFYEIFAYCENNSIWWTKVWGLTEEGDKHGLVEAV